MAINLEGYENFLAIFLGCVAALLGAWKRWGKHARSARGYYKKTKQFLKPILDSMEAMEEVKEGNPNPPLASGIAKLVQERDEARKAEWEEHCGGCRAEIDRKLTFINTNAQQNEEKTEEKLTTIQEEVNEHKEETGNSLKQGNDRFNNIEKGIKNIPKIRNGVISLASLLGKVYYSSSVISEYLMQEHKELIPKLVNTKREQETIEQIKKDLEGEE